MKDIAQVTELLSGQVFALHDYDKTTHRTDELPDGGYSVESACQFAVENTLGSSALCAYNASGGLRNRAPRAVVDSLLDEIKPEATQEKREQLTEDFISSKLTVLSKQIGTKLPDGTLWPRLVEGVEPHWKWITETEGITSGVVSSGHAVFITKSFEIHDLEPPAVLVTDDDMRKLMGVLPRHMCEKPSDLPANLAVSRWLDVLPATGERISDPLYLLKVAKLRTIFIGDALREDGEMARNAGVTFVHSPISGSLTAYEEMDFLLEAKLEEAVRGWLG